MTAVAFGATVNLELGPCKIDHNGTCDPKTFSNLERRNDMNEITRRRFFGRTGQYALGGLAAGILPQFLPAQVSAQPRQNWLALNQN